jgi:hypothetical protein
MDAPNPPCPPTAYEGIGQASVALTAAALFLYLVFCGYGIWRCYRGQDDWKGALTEKNGPTADAQLTSFSRVAAAIGAYFLTGFFIIVGGYVISRLWLRPECSGVKGNVDAMKDFVWVAVALFAPYAANQVSQIFRGTGAGGAGGDGKSASADKPASTPSGSPAYDPNKNPPAA